MLKDIFLLCVISKLNQWHFLMRYRLVIMHLKKIFQRFVCFSSWESEDYCPCLVPVDLYLTCVQYNSTDNSSNSNVLHNMCDQKLYKERGFCVSHWVAPSGTPLAWVRSEVQNDGGNLCWSNHEKTQWLRSLLSLAIKAIYILLCATIMFIWKPCMKDFWEVQKKPWPNWPPGRQPTHPCWADPCRPTHIWSCCAIWRSVILPPTFAEDPLVNSSFF